MAIPLRDVVSRQSFQSLIPLAGSGGGDLQLKALVDDIRQLYHPDVVQALAEVLNGFLERRGEATPRIEDSANVTTPIAPKEAVKNNKGEYSVRDIGSYGARYARPDVTKARERLERDFVDRQQYLAREIEPLSRKSEQREGVAGLNPRVVGSQVRECTPRRRHVILRVNALAAVCGAAITTFFVVATHANGMSPVVSVMVATTGYLVTLWLMLNAQL
jgi:hypothetical protein